MKTLLAGIVFAIGMVFASQAFALPCPNGTWQGGHYVCPDLMNETNEALLRAFLRLAENSKAVGHARPTALPSSPTLPCPRSLTLHRQGCRTGSEAPVHGLREKDASNPTRRA